MSSLALFTAFLAWLLHRKHENSCFGYFGGRVICMQECRMTACWWNMWRHMGGAAVTSSEYSWEFPSFGFYSFTENITSPFPSEKKKKLMKAWRPSGFTSVSSIKTSQLLAVNTSLMILLCVAALRPNSHHLFSYFQNVPSRLLCMIEPFLGQIKKRVSFYRT